MRQISLRSAVAIVLAVGYVAAAQSGRGDPERVLTDRFLFSESDLAQARGGQPVAKMLANAGANELAIGGAIRLDGDKSRVAGWIENIAHFRSAAELGVARVVSDPPAMASFADLALDAGDLSSLQKCTSSRCDLHVPLETISDLHAKVQWGTPAAASQAAMLFREMLVAYATAYLHGGDAALGNGFGDLVQRATTLHEIVPAFADYLQRFPAASLSGVQQRLYWSSLPTEKGAIVSLHHLAIYRGTAGDIVIADKTVYSSRYLDVGALVISLQDAEDGRGYYLIAGSRVKSSSLTSVGASLLRRTIQRSALDTVRTYLAWMRDSLAQPPQGEPQADNQRTSARPVPIHPVGR